MSWVARSVRMFQERTARVLTTATHTEFHIPLYEKIDVKQLLFEIKDQELIIKSPILQTSMNGKLVNDRVLNIPPHIYAVLRNQT